MFTLLGQEVYLAPGIRFYSEKALLNEKDSVSFGEFMVEVDFENDAALRSTYCSYREDLVDYPCRIPPSINSRQTVLHPKWDFLQSYSENYLGFFQRI